MELELKHENLEQLVSNKPILDDESSRAGIRYMYSHDHEPTSKIDSYSNHSITLVDEKFDNIFPFNSKYEMNNQPRHYEHVTTHEDPNTGFSNYQTIKTDKDAEQRRIINYKKVKPKIDTFNQVQLNVKLDQDFTYRTFTRNVNYDLINKYEDFKKNNEKLAAKMSIDFEISTPNMLDLSQYSTDERMNENFPNSTKHKNTRFKNNSSLDYYQQNSNQNIYQSNSPMAYGSPSSINIYEANTDHNRSIQQFQNNIPILNKNSNLRYYKNYNKGLDTGRSILNNQTMSNKINNSYNGIDMTQLKNNKVTKDYQNKSKAHMLSFAKRNMPIYKDAKMFENKPTFVQRKETNLAKDRIGTSIVTKAPMKLDLVSDQKTINYEDFKDTVDEMSKVLMNLE